MLDTIDRQFVVAPGPRADLPELPSESVSFGFGQLQPSPLIAPVDVTGVTYCPRQQVQTIDGTPAVDQPQMRTSIQHTTTEDHQSWTDTTYD